MGSTAPDFRLVDGELNDLTLADFAGKKKLISIVPSLDTPTCALSTKVFNEKLGGRDDVVVLVVSADLPFAQGRFCQAEGTADVKTLSMMRSRNFAKDYGMLIEDGPLGRHHRTCRAGAGREQQGRARRTGARDRPGARLRRGDCRLGLIHELRTQRPRRAQSAQSSLV